jgi:uncharacterized protein YdaU (DUF1376 family)
MSALPFMPLYVGDYLADAGHLSTVEHGAYFLLIMAYWQRGEPLVDDDKKLARIARLSQSDWPDVRDALEDLFVVADGLWSHKRIDRELAKAIDKVEKARRAGEASGAARAKRASVKRQPDVEPNESDRPAPVQHAFDGGLTDAERPLNVRSTDDGGEFNHKSRVDKIRVNEEEEGAGDRGALAVVKDPPISILNVVTAWKAMAKANGLPTIVGPVSERRKAAMRARISEFGEAGVLDAIAKIPDHPFLVGQNDRGWKADFDFMCRPDSIGNILGGKYHGNRSGGRASGWGFAVSSGVKGSGEGGEGLGWMEG